MLSFVIHKKKSIIKTTEGENKCLLCRLIEIQCLFSLQPPTHSRTTTREPRRRQEGLQRFCEQQEWHRTTERIACSPAIRPANVHLATSSTTLQTHPPPSPLTVSMATLCFSVLSPRGRLSKRIIKWALPQNKPTCRDTLFKQRYCANTVLFLASNDRR